MYSKSVMLTLLAMLAVCNALNISADSSHNVSLYEEDTEKQMEKIANGIDKTSNALKETKNLITSNKPPNINSALKLVQEWSTLGSLVFPQLKVFSSSLNLLNGLIDGGTSADARILKGI